MGMYFRLLFGFFIFSLIFLDMFGATDDVENIPDGPRLVFGGNNIVRFGKIKLKNFYKCLCNNTMTSCTYRYSFKYEKSPMYYQVGNPAEMDDLTSTVMTENNFICLTEPFTGEKGFLSCIRSTDLFSWCIGKIFCQPVCVNLTQNDEFENCSFMVINIMWLTRELRGEQFGTNNVPAFDNGLCNDPKPTHSDENPTESTSTVTPESTSPENKVIGEPIGQRSSTSESKSVTPVTAVGWILFALAMVIIIVLIVFLCRKRKLNPKGSSFERSNSRPNIYTGHSTEAVADDRAQRSDVKGPESGKDRSDYDYYTPYGVNLGDYNVIEEHKVEDTMRKLNKLNKTKAGLTEYDLQSPVRKTFLAGTTGEVGFSDAKQPDNSGERKQEQATLEETGEENHGYMILEADNELSSRNSMETAGIPSTYNLKFSSAPIEEPVTRTDKDDDRIESLNMTEYDRLKNGKLLLTQDADMSYLDTYNTESTLFEARDKTNKGGATNSTGSPYDVPKLDDNFL